MDKPTETMLTYDDTSTFVDPETGERYAPYERLDPHGTPLIGEDEWGLWWGTERAAWVLSEGSTSRLVRFTGTICRTTVKWDGFFIGTDDEATLYAECHGVTVAHLEPGG
jgi:hypothetical protein